MFQFVPIVVPLLATTVATGLATGMVYRKVESFDPGSAKQATNLAMFLVLLMVTLVALGQVVAVSTTAYASILAGMYLTLIAGLWLAASWVVFALYYTGREEMVTRRRLVLLSIGPAVGSVAIAANVGGLFLVDPELQRAGSRTVLSFGWGIGAWGVAIHNWTNAAIGSWFLVQKFRSSRNVYRKITFLNLVGAVVVNVPPVFSLAGRSPFPYLTFSMIAFSVVIAVGAAGMLSYRVFQVLPLGRFLALFGSRWRDLTPMARDTVVQRMQSGIIVVDHDNRIVDVNPMGKLMIGAENRRVIGQPLTDVVPPEIFVTEDTSFLDPETTTGEYNGIWVETPEGENRCFDVEVTGLGSEADPAGRVVLITDVTERELRKEKLEQRTRELERQNDQLENFASIVSHDLRNPLNVARGHLQIARETGDESAIEEAETSLDRMEAIIEDVLTLARQGQSIGETEPVSLDEVAREAWSNVDTPEATLEVQADIEIEADPNRLLNLFENLYRNARDHARPDVTVTVGVEDGLFYVADDGPGIPEDRRDEVFESGHTTDEDGTGFGLAIVSQVADAHGWETAVTDAASGGARFEFRGIERAHGTRLPS